MRWLKAYNDYKAYGCDYVQFNIVDEDRLEEWRGLNFPDFRQALANANAPHFDPEEELRLPDTDGTLYNAAVYAAWDTLLVAFAREDEREEE